MHEQWVSRQTAVDRRQANRQRDEAEDPVAEVAALLAAAVANARKVIERRDTRAPAASLVTQLNRFARELGLATNADAIAVEAELRAGLGGSLARQVDISGRDVPTGDDLLTLLSTTHPARYPGPLECPPERVEFAEPAPTMHVDATANPWPLFLPFDI